MKLTFSIALLGALSAAPVPAATAQQAPASPYHTSLLGDGAITAGVTAVSFTGLYLIQQKRGLSDPELAALDRRDVPKIDRFAAGWYSASAQTASDFLCYGAMAVAPGLLAFNPNARGRYGQVLGLYLQTMLATDAAFTMTVGTVYRYRPYLYGSEGGSIRNGKVATNSFFAGHTAHSATATFFAAKVFHDFNPGSAAEPVRVGRRGRLARGGGLLPDAGGQALPNRQPGGLRHRQHRGHHGTPAAQKDRPAGPFRAARPRPERQRPFLRRPATDQATVTSNLVVEIKRQNVMPSAAQHLAWGSNSFVQRH
jgi:hypothetical protein